MPLMKSRWSGNVGMVDPAHVAAHVGRGWSLLEDFEAPADEPEPEPQEAEPETDDAGEPEAAAAPTEESTIAEIRAYAKAHGIETPKRGTKAELLALVGAVESDG